MSGQQPAVNPAADPPANASATSTADPPAAAPAADPPAAAASPVAPGSPPASALEQHRVKAAQEVRAQEHQRILGLAPNFNTSNVADAEPLSAKQKFELAAHSALDPFTFVASGFDALLSQAENNFRGYGQGAEGYGKRFGASYLDSFDGTMLGNAVFPTLLKQDPRYFRQGMGSVRSRLFHAIMSTFECRDDHRKWVPNYSNILGNIAAGGISNLYYPASDRGAELTFERAAVVTGEGAIGAIFVEFWPDISRRLFPKKAGKDLP